MIKIMEYDKKFIEAFLSRSQFEYRNVQKTVDEILDNVKKNGDKALFEYTKKFDDADINTENFIVTKEIIKEAYRQTDKELIKVIEKSAQRIADFHKKQKVNSWFEPNNGEILGQLIRPLERVGVYVPGGKAAYPSTVLMNVIPAKVAGVNEIVIVTPPKINPSVLVAADIAGVDVIYKVGGAQAIGALAYGTESIKKVDKIVGPGNIFVALAKKSVFGYTNIDSIAGPSEILIIADDTADPIYIAADLLSQAEHDELASAILITTSKKLAKKVQAEIEKQIVKLERKEIIKKSIDNYGAIITVENIDIACEDCNLIAPEHLELYVAEPFNLLSKIKNAGAIFLGHYTPEPLGDYIAGPNHVLPTNGTARFFSPLSVDDFVKKSSIISFSKKALSNLGEDIIKFANAEGLTAHANSIKVRL